MLGLKSGVQINSLLEQGGTVFDALNERAANLLASQLKEAGAEVEVVPSEDDKERKQQLFRVNLFSFGKIKIHIIKVVREVTGLGLNKSKELVNNLGIVQNGVFLETAIKAKAKFEDAGATVTLKSIGEPNQSDEFVVHGKEIKLANSEPVTPFEYEQLSTMITPVLDSTALSILTDEVFGA